MKALALVVLAACDLGIGSDPQSGPHPCLPGNVQEGGGCFVPHVAFASGAITGWDAIVPVEGEPACTIAPCDNLRPTAIRLGVIGVSTADVSSLAVYAHFPGEPAVAPDVRFVVTVSASDLRPATTGSDRVILASAVHYEKNGFAVTSTEQPFDARMLADGFEATISDVWLPFQGAGTITVTAERLVGGAQWTAIAPSAPITACWSFRDTMPAGCEALP